MSIRNTIQNQFYILKASHSKYLYLFLVNLYFKNEFIFSKNKKLIACMKRFKNLQDFRFHLSSPVSFLTINMQTSIFSCYVYIRARICIAGARYPPARKMKTLRVQKYPVHVTRNKTVVLCFFIGMSKG